MKLNEAHEWSSQEPSAREQIKEALGAGPDYPEPEKMLQWAKGRALEYANGGKLKEAIDSMVSELGKDPSRDPFQMQMIGMMAMGLRGKADLGRDEVVDWINGFN